MSGGGTVPFPATNSAALRQVAAAYGQLASDLASASSQLTGAVTTATGSGAWSGSAATAWARHTGDRATFVANLGTTLQQVPPALDSMAGAIDSSTVQYEAAATAEQSARQGLPYTAVALAQALGQETEAVLALEAAGVRCAASLVGILASLASDEVSLAAHGVLSDLEGIPAAAIHAVVSAANAVAAVPLPGGDTLRVNLLGAALNANPVIPAAEQVVGDAIRVLEPQLHVTADDGSLLSGLEANGVTPEPASLTQLGHDLSTLESWKPDMDDKSALVLNTVGTQADGTRNLTVEIGGINPSGALDWSTGARDILDASADQITGWGRQEQAVYDDVLAQGVQPGDTVNLYGHSQGGIVMENVANQLASDGYHVNLVTMGSPETQLDPSINATLLQDQGDAVPAARVAGIGGTLTVDTANQQVVTTDTGLDPLTAHDPQSYGAWAAANPGNSGVQAATATLAGAVNLQNVTSNVVVVSGAGSTPVKVPQPPSPSL